MADLTCGWLIGGDPLRPCMKKSGHKHRGHEDAEQAERRRKRQTTEESRARRRERYNTLPEVQERRLETDRAWRGDNRERDLANRQGASAARRLAKGTRLVVREHVAACTATVYNIPVEAVEDDAALMHYLVAAVWDYHAAK